MIFCRIHSTSFPPEPISGKIVHYTVLLKGNVALARILFSSELGYSSEQRVEEMTSQANTRLEPLAQLSFLFIQWFLLDVVSHVVSTHQKTRYSTTPRVLERFNRGEAFDSWYCNSVGLYIYTYVHQLNEKN